MFQGFSPETIDFLWGLRLNNYRDWFMAHKDEYQKHLYDDKDTAENCIKELTK